MDLSSLRLTETVAKGGCAAKLPAGQLRQLLGRLDLPAPAELVVGTQTMDDACLWDLGDGRYLVQTLDFFTPIVDDARDFGRIAAANALSDVYAMGGLPKIALSILCFPTAKLPLELLEPLMDGAVSTLKAAGACLAGGHTIDDETLKLGFAVTGFVRKDSAWTNAGARAGDALILTKGLGTGTVTSALKSKRAEPAWVEAAVASMTMLNDTTGLLDGITVHAATDVTGFGLAGHGLQTALASGLTFEISLESLPTLAGATACLEQGILNRAHHSNAHYVAAQVRYDGGTDLQRWLTVDPQTSGGLLLCVREQDAEQAVRRLRSRFPLAARIGTAVSRHDDTEPSLIFRSR